MPSGNKPLLEPMLTQIHVAIWHHWATTRTHITTQSCAYFMGCTLFISLLPVVTHWGRGTLICVGKLTIIGSDNGLSPARRQTIIWTNAVILLIAPWGTNFREILIGIQTFSFMKMRLKMSSAKWRPFCLDPNVLTGIRISKYFYRFQ